MRCDSHAYCYNYCIHFFNLNNCSIKVFCNCTKHLNKYKDSLFYYTKCAVIQNSYKYRENVNYMKFYKIKEK